MFKDLIYIIISSYASYPEYIKIACWSMGGLAKLDTPSLTLLWGYALSEIFNSCCFNIIIYTELKYVYLCTKAFVFTYTKQNKKCVCTQITCSCIHLHAYKILKSNWIICFIKDNICVKHQATLRWVYLIYWYVLFSQFSKCIRCIIWTQNINRHVKFLLKNKSKIKNRW